MTTRTRSLVVTLALLAALSGCSASDSSVGAGPEEMGDVAARPAPDGAYDAGGDAAEGAADATSDVGAAQQQVVQTAYVTLTSPDPVAAAREVVALVTRLEGRVDARYERSGTEADEPGYASLTVRVPSHATGTFTDALGEVADVLETRLETEDVTSAALDLDARVEATELSVARMADLLARASTHSDVIEAERALTQRQAELERLRSERARLTERVALSTVEIEIHAPDRAPEPLDETPPTFLDGLATGWAAFTTFVRGVLVLVGVLLPWLVLGGLVLAGVLVWRRRRARGAGPQDSGPRPPAGPPAGPQASVERPAPPAPPAEA